MSCSCADAEANPSIFPADVQAFRKNFALLPLAVLSFAPPHFQPAIMSEPEIVISSTSPHGTLEAIIDQDERVSYLYLRATNNEALGVKTCWVRNFVKAPEKLDVAGMREGIPPMLPRANCRYPKGQPPLDPQRLEIVWLPEGDGVAVLENGEMLASIPPWGGSGDFSGYARDCVGKSQFCWGLEDPSVYNHRIAAAKEYWASWDQDPSPWALCQDVFLAAYEKVLGPHACYFGIDRDEWPPRALIRVDHGDRVYLLTLGISLRPQPVAEMYVEDAAQHRRFEMAACFSSTVADELIMKLADYIAAQSDFPWRQFTFLAHGHTIGCDTFESDPTLYEHSALLLVKDPAGAPRFELPTMNGDPVSLLWLVPITQSERELAQEEGSKGLLPQMRPPETLHVIGERAPRR